MLLKILFGMLLVLLGLWTLSAFIHLKTPTNILLFLPKKLYSSLISQLLVGFLVLLLSQSLFFLWQTATHESIDPFYYYTYFVLWGYTLAGFAYCDVIRHAAVKSGFRQSLLEKALHEKSGPLPPFKEKDLTPEKNSSQFTLFTPQNGMHHTTCLFYLDYERWNPSYHPKETVCLRDLSLSEGYSFCVYSSNNDNKTSLWAIIRDICDALDVLRAHTAVSKVILVGSGSGGHLALAAALSHPSTHLDPLQSQIAGVLALSPSVDLASDYILFTGKDEHNKSYLDHLGDKLFNHLLKDGSLSDSYQRLMKQLIGGSYEDLAPLYESASIKTMLNASDFPILIIHGSQDSFCPIESTRELYNELNTQNKTISFLELPYVEHGFDILLINHSVIGNKLKREITNWLYTYFK